MKYLYNVLIKEIPKNLTKKIKPIYFKINTGFELKKKLLWSLKNRPEILLINFLFN